MGEKVGLSSPKIETFGNHPETQGPQKCEYIDKTFSDGLQICGIFLVEFWPAFQSAKQMQALSVIVSTTGNAAGNIDAENATSPPRNEESCSHSPKNSEDDHDHFHRSNESS
jgi:hypothetical protein